MSSPATVHASVAVVGDRGVIIRGESGSGKSSLLLALVMGDERQNALIADDRVVLAAHHGRLVASSPPELAGLVEVRGQGVMRRAYLTAAVVDLAVDLLPPSDCPRMPPEDDAVELCGVRLPRLALPVGQSDKVWRVRLALAERFAWRRASQPLALRP